jgi:ribosome-associated protein
LTPTGAEVPASALDYVFINKKLRVPRSDLRFSFSRSPGPGGQNVNKVNTRVTLLFDVHATSALTPGQKTRVLEELRTRIDSDGVMRVVSSRHRTQAANRRATVERFAGLLADALAPRKRRLKTRVPRAAVERRLQDKARRAQRKQQRRYRPTADG